jgi:hypothetical protein
LTMMSSGNGTNCPTNTRLQPSQTKVMLLGS